MPCPFAILLLVKFFGYSLTLHYALRTPHRNEPFMILCSIYGTLRYSSFLATKSTHLEHRRYFIYSLSLHQHQSRVDTIVRTY